MTLFDWQKNVLKGAFGDQADDVIAWVNEHLTPSDDSDRQQEQTSTRR